MIDPDLPPGEPAADPWRAVAVNEVLARIRDAAGPVDGRPVILALDGRGGAGKSTLARRIAHLADNAPIVRTDDLAWNEPFFAWGHLLADGILRPLHRGEAVAFRPPAWEAHCRSGRITVPAGSDLVIVDGTGASHREHADLVDATIWVQTPMQEAERRGIARDVAEGVNGDRRQATAFWHEWMRHELAFFRRERPWERACLIVNGSAKGASGEELVEIAVPA